MTAPTLCLTQVSHGYGRSSGRLLQRISLEVNAGETLAVLGPSGCGKTSLLRIACGRVAPSDGQAEILGAPSAEQRHLAAYCAQHPVVLPWMTVRRNVGLPQRVGHHLGHATTDELLDLLGLSSIADRRASPLSGGELQRVALGRAIASESPLLVLDEPLGAVDSNARNACQELILEECRSHGRAALMSTHAVEEALFLASEIAVLGRRGEIDKLENAARGHREGPGIAQMRTSILDLMSDAPSAP
jgi:ABC-type nitrate/sulfonate/bicarbonate transport system ATPase subunit